MGFPLLGAGLISSGVNSLFRLGTGVAQLFKSRQYRQERPTYEIPEEVRAGLGLRQAQLNARSQAAAIAGRGIQESQAASMQNMRQGATGSASLLSAASMLQGNTNRSLRSIAMQEEAAYNQRLAGLEQQQRQMAAYRDREFQVNQMEPYQDAMRARSALIEGGLQNIGNAFADTSATLGQMYYMDQMNPGFLGDVFQGAGAQQPASIPIIPQNWSPFMTGFNSGIGIGRTAGMMPAIMNPILTGFGSSINRRPR